MGTVVEMEKLNHLKNHNVVLDFTNLYRSVNREDPIRKWQDFCFECSLDAIFHFDYELSDNMDDPLNLIVSCADCLSGAFASERDSCGLLSNLQSDSNEIGVTKVVCSTVLRYMLSDEELRLLDKNSNHLISRQKVVNHFMQHLPLTSQLSVEELESILEVCLARCCAGDIIPTSAVFSSFAFIGGLCSTLSLTPSIARKVLNALSEIALKETRRSNFPFLSKLVERNPELIQCETFPVLFLLLSALLTGDGPDIFESFDCFADSCSDRSEEDNTLLRLSNRGSILRMAFLLAPIACADSGPQVAALLSAVCLLHTLCGTDTSSSKLPSTAAAPAADSGACCFVMHSSDWNLFISNDMHLHLVCGALFQFLQLLLDTYKGSPSFGRVLLSLLCESPMSTLQEALFNGNTLSSFKSRQLCSVASSGTCGSSLPGLVHNCFLVYNACDFSVEEGDSRSGLAGLECILTLLLLDSAPSPNQTANINQQSQGNPTSPSLAMRLLDDDCFYSCKLFHVFERLVQELKLAFNSASLFPVDLLDENKGTAQDMLIRGLPTLRGEGCQRVQSIVVQLSLIMHSMSVLAVKCAGRFFHYSIFTSSMLETIFQAACAVVLCTLDFEGGHRDQVSVFFDSWKDLLIALTQLGSRFDKSICTGCKNSLHLLVAAASPCQAGHQRDTAAASGTADFRATIQFRSSVVQIVFSLSERRRIEAATTTMKRKQESQAEDSISKRSRLDGLSNSLNNRRPMASNTQDDDFRGKFACLAALCLLLSHLQDSFVDSEHALRFSDCTLSLLVTVLPDMRHSAMAKEVADCIIRFLPSQSFSSLCTKFLVFIIEHFINSREVKIGHCLNELENLQKNIVSNVLQLIALPTLLGLEQLFPFLKLFSNVFDRRSALRALCREAFISSLAGQVTKAVKSSSYAPSEVVNESIPTRISIARSFSILLSHIFSKTLAIESVMEMAVEEVLHFIQVDGMLKSVFAVLGDSAREAGVSRKNMTLQDLLSYCSEIISKRLLGRSQMDMDGVLLMVSICLDPTTQFVDSQSSHLSMTLSDLNAALSMVHQPVAFVRLNEAALRVWVRSAIEREPRDQEITGPAILTFAILLGLLGDWLSICPDSGGMDISLAYIYWLSCEATAEDLSHWVSRGRVSAQRAVSHDSSNNNNRIIFCVTLGLFHEMQACLKAVRPVEASLSRVGLLMGALQSIVKGIFSDNEQFGPPGVSKMEEAVDLYGFVCIEQLLFLVGSFHEPHATSISALFAVLSMASDLQTHISAAGGSTGDEYSNRNHSNVQEIIRLSVGLLSDASRSDMSRSPAVHALLRLFCSHVLQVAGATFPSGPCEVLDWRDSASLSDDVQRLKKDLSVQEQDLSESEKSSVLLFEFLSLKISQWARGHSQSIHAELFWTLLHSEIALPNSLDKLLLRIIWNQMAAEEEKREEEEGSRDLMRRAGMFCLLCLMSAELVGRADCDAAARECITAELPSSAALLRCLLLRCQELLLATDQCEDILLSRGRSSQGEDPNHGLSLAVHQLRRCAMHYKEKITHLPSKVGPAGERGREREREREEGPIATLLKLLRCQPWLSLLSETSADSHPDRGFSEFFFQVLLLS